MSRTVSMQFGKPGGVVQNGGSGGTTATKIYYQDIDFGTINASATKTVSFTFDDSSAKDAVWVTDAGTSNRVGVIYELPSSALTDVGGEVWAYNTRTASATSCKARIFYTLA